MFSISMVWLLPRSHHASDSHRYLRSLFDSVTLAIAVTVPLDGSGTVVNRHCIALCVNLYVQLQSIPWYSKQIYIGFGLYNIGPRFLIPPRTHCKQE